MKLSLKIALLAAVGTLVACADASRDDPLVVTTSGSFIATTYVDRNLNNTFEIGEDQLLAGVPVVLLRGATDTVQRRVTDSFGVAEFKSVPVGTYRVAAARAAVTDTLELAGIENEDVTIAANDTTLSTLHFSYSLVTVNRIRQLPSGRRVQLRATALHSWLSFADSTLHVVDSTGTMRLYRVEPAAFSAGDVLRMVGTTSVVDGRATLRDVSVNVLSTATLPAATPISTASGSTANAGALDAALVRITNAIVLSWQTATNGEVTATVNDGSGKLDVVISRTAGIDLSRLERGAALDATGILVPARTAGIWQLKPRVHNDVQLTLPIMTVRAIRDADVGRRVRLKASALNGWSAFADGTVHVQDATGSIRVTGVPAMTVFAGDTLEIFGTIGAEAGQAILRDGSLNLLALGIAPSPTSITLANAITADNGRLDAALVRLPTATISDTLSIGRDYGVALPAGTDTLRVILDGDAGVAIGPLLPGAGIEVTGLLVPTANGRNWIVKPRGRGDVVVRTPAPPPTPPAPPPSPRPR